MRIALVKREGRAMRRRVVSVAALAVLLSWPATGSAAEPAATTRCLVVALTRGRFRSGPARVRTGIAFGDLAGGRTGAPEPRYPSV